MDARENGYDEINNTLNESLDDSTVFSGNELRTIGTDTNDQIYENRTSEDATTGEATPRINRRHNVLLIISIVTRLVANQLLRQQSRGLTNHILDNNMSVFFHLDWDQNNVISLPESNMLGINQNLENETSLNNTSEIQNGNESEPSDASTFVNNREDESESENMSRNGYEYIPGNEYNYNRHAEDDTTELLSSSETEYIRLLEGGASSSLYVQSSENNLRGSITNTPINQKSDNRDNGFSELIRILDGDYSYDHETERFEYTYSPENRTIEFTPISSLTLSRNQYDDYNNAVFADKQLIEGNGSIANSVDSDDYDYDYEHEYEIMEARRNLNTNRIPINDIYRFASFTIPNNSNNNISFNISENYYDDDIFFYNDREYAIGRESSRINQNNYNTINYGNVSYGYDDDDDGYDYEFGNFEFTYSRPNYMSYRGDGMISLDDPIEFDNDDLNISNNINSQPSIDHETNYRNNMTLRRPSTEEFTFGNTPPSAFSLNTTPSNNNMDNDDDDIEILNDVTIGNDAFDEVDLNREPMSNINWGRFMFNDATINGTSFNDIAFTQNEMGNYSFGTLRSRDLLSNVDANPDNIENLDINISDFISLDNGNDGSDSELQPILVGKENSYESDNGSNGSEYYDTISAFGHNNDEGDSGSDEYFESANNIEPIQSCSTSTTAESCNKNSNNTCRIKENCEKSLNSNIR
ncbi:conserved Plasmodium protein, unknown function [Plasmodium berghei]|uniref:Uncharacterized protein n=2 Tax=Plasmodium berghei TaxID=5821 RepID=A0A509AJ18_PLABA|nr:conserved Plasmodium protein, unknown function [Plasmodium berghei ANKA]CXI37401.1 conserved Plasmodium protein, unknown function [Plasmodium berghei]SCM21669.1 conserved Plasmodium protein, unknown function [Plasmodium berghei]SCN24865.1 conserved Plasmodium protein, unknown function [Plasmodium berghei]SCO59980.1 conserved Plasmodium protein, unknown function [Plasmodium berghei]SCO61368.1 conserved Plasmodium protein, unknown function [Plasmodium berghei]|eukprot:XP_034421336.1 conserved Plasmodium protein, unknown function [Plasmodium berghei ANKA]